MEESKELQRVIGVLLLGLIVGFFVGGALTERSNYSPTPRFETQSNRPFHRVCEVHNVDDGGIRSARHIVFSPVDQSGVYSCVEDQCEGVTKYIYCLDIDGYFAALRQDIEE